LKVLRVMALLGLSALVIFACSCSKKKKAEREDFPPVISSIGFSPTVPVAGQDLKAVIKAEAFGKNKSLTATFKWHRNRELIPGQESDTLPGSEVRADTEIYVEAKASDGVKESEWLQSRPVRAIAGLLQINRVWIEPEQPSRNDTLVVKVECENCEWARIHYRWFVNNYEVQGATEQEFSAAKHELKIGDNVIAQISVEPNYPVVWEGAAPVTITARVPEIMDSGRVWVSNSERLVYFQFRVRDPEGGTLSYQVDSPPGASLKADQSLVTWPVPKGFTGEVVFKIKVRSSEGRETDLSGQIHIEEQ